MHPVKVARIYCTEGEKSLQALLHYLQEEAKVRGVTVFRGISGFGQSGALHASSLVDLSFDLPLVVEFFDIPEKVERIIQQLNKTTSPGHIIIWDAQMN